jgi:hypothetical protein
MGHIDYPGTITGLFAYRPETDASVGPGSWWGIGCASTVSAPRGARAAAALLDGTRFAAVTPPGQPGAGDAFCMVGRYADGRRPAQRPGAGGRR